MRLTESQRQALLVFAGSLEPPRIHSAVTTAPSLVDLGLLARDDGYWFGYRMTDAGVEALKESTEGTGNG